MPFGKIISAIKQSVRFVLNRMGYALIHLPQEKGRQEPPVSLREASPGALHQSLAAPYVIPQQQPRTNGNGEPPDLKPSDSKDQTTPVCVGAHIFQRSSLSELLDALEDCARPIARCRRVLVWPFERTGATGHLCMEPFYIKSLYGDVFDEIVVITRQRHSCHNSNTEIFDVAMADMKVAYTDDPRLLDLSSYEIGVIERGPFVFLLHSYTYISRAFFRHCLSGGKKAFFQMTDDQEERGRQALCAIGVPNGAKWVVAHAREPGFHPGALHDYRCTSVESYFDSIRFLVKQGYFVLRIGDRSMKRLPELGPQVIDVPFVKNYDFKMDVFAIAHCQFMISAHSGPCMLARAFNRPCLAVNVPVTYPHIPGESDMLAWRRYYRRDKKDRVARQLSYQDILDSQLQFLGSDADFLKTGIEFRELSSAEVLPITREMLRKTESSQHIQPSKQDRFMDVNRAANDIAAADMALQKKYGDWYGCAKPGAVVSDVYCDMNPGFL